ncbi:SGNH/GDSL hydrolase family protein [Streptomyces sp. NPDC015131]|uniref:SGNH/GDSL hydrolase family protein n=1 Tax=Streptomyces sp. NPDC015131 TaxID=3364941 RepID=UPI0036FD8526
MNPFLLPVLAAQGLYVRWSTESLPPAGGPVTGVYGDEAEARRVLRVAVVGESTAAGVGVERHADGFTGQFARALHERTGHPVAWSVAGLNGATLEGMRSQLLPTVEPGQTVAVLLAGVNDVLRRRDPREWGRELAAVAGTLADRAEHVVVTGVPPFGEFPALPGTLRRYLAARAAALDEVSRQVCADLPTVTWSGVTGVLPMGPDFFARDRFHPSAHGYAQWAGIVAGQVAP